jgi:hypothetical protein
MRLSNLGLYNMVVLSLEVVTGSGQMGYSNQQSVSITKVVGKNSGGDYLTATKSRADITPTSPNTARVD